MLNVQNQLSLSPKAARQGMWIGKGQNERKGTLRALLPTTAP